MENTVEVELDEQVVLLNDCILMCSDGLYDMVDDDVSDYDSDQSQPVEKKSYEQTLRLVPDDTILDFALPDFLQERSNYTNREVYKRLVAAIYQIHKHSVKNVAFGRKAKTTSAN